MMMSMKNDGLTPRPRTDDRFATVTGACEGIGRAFAVVLAARRCGLSQG
jgi:hypothetical protein